LFRFRNTRFRDKLRRSFTKRFMEQACEVPAGHGRSLGESVYGKIVAQMRQDPRWKIGKTVRRLDLKL